jgi:hypothetical protein
MNGPFPGMNPYLESSEDLWTGFHNVLISDIGKLLSAHLPHNYTALVKRRVELIELSNDPSRRRQRDISVALLLPADGMYKQLKGAFLAPAIVDK